MFDFRELLIISKSRLSTKAIHRLSEGRVKLVSTMPNVGASTKSNAEFTNVNEHFVEGA